MDFVLSSIFTQLNVGEIGETVGHDRAVLVKMVEHSSPYHVLQISRFSVMMNTQIHFLLQY